MKEQVSRREFLGGSAAVMGATAMAAGCVSAKNSLGFGVGGAMHGFKVAPMGEVRVGVIGVGGRGEPAVHRLAQIPGVRVTAISDINAERLDKVQGWLKENGYAAAKEWSRDGDEEAWKGLCDSDVCDVVYSATPRPLHCPINVFALSRGKHVMQEVPGAFSLDECWQTVEAAEKYRRHCMMLENCTYGEAEMLAFVISHKGLLGEVVQAEVGYTHDQRNLQYNPTDGRFWRIKRHLEHHGNYYPTHGLVPAGRVLDINRGDRFDYLVAMETKSAGFEEFGRMNFPESDWRYSAKMTKGDITMCMLHTAKGKQVVLKHDVSNPCPYDRGNFYTGSRGVFRGIKFADEGQGAEYAYTNGSPCRFGWIEEPKGHLGGYFDFARANKLREEYRHPFWKAFGEISQIVGGHGGMDFVMDLRWVYCLQNGLPMDTDVYDLATYSSVVELSEKSILNRSSAMDFPDYTRGGWQTAAPFAIDEMEASKFDFKGVRKDANAQRT